MSGLFRFHGNPGSLVLMLCLYLNATAAMAEEVPGAGHASFESMNQVEYEIYRNKLQQHVKDIASNTQKQDLETDENEFEQNGNKPAGSGYGQGYRARTEPGTRAGGGYRGGSANRGGGRNR
ncbi:MAG: hypothetical protein A3H31_10855 [Gallionellales bacterium RIFCSPLOWO2_02_FULL_57_47]|nr:MAG: hypothetical protein A3H31_10855 [Gallionellales bacterium RIFCSPLOWO2_02_FULL_57_47]OGT16544.1 MAG: hypothetical protein A3J49_05255 [Gallionellales bacterium RIFCSPHIGHO2_02_FULL_57_16]